MKIFLLDLYKFSTLNEKDFKFYLNNAYHFLCTIYEHKTLTEDLNVIPENNNLNGLYGMDIFKKLKLKF